MPALTTKLCLADQRELAGDSLELLTTAVCDKRLHPMKLLTAAVSDKCFP